MSDKQAAPAAANDSAPAPADPGTPPKRSRLTKIASIVAGVFAVLIIGIKVLGFFMLPACDSHAVTQTLKEIFAGKQVTVNVLNDIKALTDTNKEKVCSGACRDAGREGDRRIPGELGRQEQHRQSEQGRDALRRPLPIRS